MYKVSANDCGTCSLKSRCTHLQHSSVDEFKLTHCQV
jgi:hypothetical protein